MKRVRITDNGDPRKGGCKIEAVDKDGVVIEDLTSRCYGYDLSSRAFEQRKATLFVYAAVEATTDAEIVEVPRSLAERARDMAARIGNPAVTTAFGELLGVSMSKPSSDDGDQTLKLMRDIADAVSQVFPDKSRVEA